MRVNEAAEPKWKIYKKHATHTKQSWQYRHCFLISDKFNKLQKCTLEENTVCVGMLGKRVHGKMF